MKLKQLIFLFIAIFVMAGCDDAEKAKNISDCKFDYESITDLKVGDIVIVEDMEASDIQKILALLEGKDAVVPMTCTFNVRVTNPNESAAEVDELEYKVSIDNVANVAHGRKTDKVSVPGGQSLVVALPMVIDDLIPLLEQEDFKNALINLIENVIGMGERSTEFKLEITPTVKILGIPIDSPVSIPVTFTYP